MTPWLEIASTLAPDGGPLSLWRRGEELAIRAGSIVLMSSRVHETEEMLAQHGCRGLVSDARVLIGGLGMGFTLREAERALDRAARIVVAEACADVVAWARGPIGAADVLDDPRVTIEIGLVETIIESSEASFDAILLDVDNGPSALTLATNARLYDDRGVRAIARALRPGGRVVVWSRGDDGGFAARLARAGLEVDRTSVRANQGRGERHVLFTGVRVGAPDPDRRSRPEPSDRTRDPRNRRRGSR